MDDPHKARDRKAWAGQVLRVNGHDALAEEMEAWQPPTFPVAGRDLIAAGCPKGPAVSAVTKALKEVWKESGFARTKEELLEKDFQAAVDSIKLEDFEPRSKKKKKNKA